MHNDSSYRGRNNSCISINQTNKAPDTAATTNKESSDNYMLKNGGKIHSIHSMDNAMKPIQELCPTRGQRQWPRTSVWRTGTEPGRSCLIFSLLPSHIASFPHTSPASLTPHTRLLLTCSYGLFLMKPPYNSRRPKIRSLTLLCMSSWVIIPWPRIRVDLKRSQVTVTWSISY